MPSVEDLSPEEEAIHREFNRFRGRLAGFIEACNLSPRQERGLVSTMKSMSYDTERDVIKHVSGE
jgi:hypothetical protein